MENVENTISEPLDFKIFWGRMSTDPPHLQTRASGARFQAPQFQRGTIQAITMSVLDNEIE